MKKIRLIHVVGDLSIGGLTSIVIDLCNNADHEKFDVSIISLSHNLIMLTQKPLKKEIDIFQFNYYFDANYSLRHYFELWLNKSIIKRRAKKIVDKIKSLNPDILNFHVLPRELPIGILAANDGLNVKLVFTDHLKRIGSRDYRYINRELLKFIYRSWYKHFNIISVGRSVERSNRINGFLNPKHHHKLIENRVNYPDSPVKRAADNKINLVYVARLDHGKGHFDLLRAWVNLNCHCSCKLWIIGGGSLENQLKAYVKEHVKDNSVVFTGAIDNVEYYLSIADIGLFPSYKEGLPLALLEKMAMGIPVITSDIEELTDIISHEKNGLVYNLGNIKDLQEKLKRLINDGGLRTKLGKNARLLVKSRFCDGPLIKHYEFYYNSLLNLN